MLEGRFCGVGACCLLAAGALWLFAGGAVGPVSIAEDTGAGCGHAAAGESELTADERRIVAWVADLLQAGGSPEIDEEDLMRALDLSREAVAALDVGKLRVAVFAELARRGVDRASLNLGNCERYSACSVDRNLNHATGDELARYEREVALDGRAFEGWVAPPFELPTTAGDTVALSSHRGKNVVLVFLSGHCYHSLDTLPILGELRRKYADVVFLPVFINSGDVEQLASRAWELEVDYPLVVSRDKAIAQAYDSRMVPSTFLIDEQGRVTRKLVGFKDQAALDAAIAELVRS
jgi:peroxiredoxin